MEQPYRGVVVDAEIPGGDDVGGEVRGDRGDAAGETQRVEAFAVVCAGDGGDERAHHLAGELVGAHVATQSLDFVAAEGVLSRSGDRDVEDLPVFRVFFGDELELIKGVGVAHRGAGDNRPAMIVGESRPHDRGERLLAEQRELVQRCAVEVQAAQPFHSVGAAVELDRPAVRK
ncbi:MAG TPA: hypothetical protein VGG77_13650 [Roseiarcus sp.]